MKLLCVNCSKKTIDVFLKRGFKKDVGYIFFCEICKAMIKVIHQQKDCCNLPLLTGEGLIPFVGMIQ